MHFFKLWSFIHRKSIIFLTIHGVMDVKDGGQWIPVRKQISRDALDQALKLICKYYTFVSIGDAVAMLKKKTPFRNYSIVLTFDDGYRNNLTHALPILKKYNIPAAIFPAVGHIDRREPFWFDRLDYILQVAIKDGGDYVQIGDNKIALSSEKAEDTNLIVMKAIREVKKLSGNDRDIMYELDKELSRLERKHSKSLKEISENDKWTGLARWNEFKAALSDGVTVGSHTINHSRLSLLTKEEALIELADSKKYIESRLNKSCHYVCYPNGAYNNEVADLAKVAGYKAGLTTEEGFNKVGSSLMTLKRVHLPQDASAVECLAVASGLSLKLSSFIKRIRVK